MCHMSLEQPTRSHHLTNNGVIMDTLKQIIHEMNAIYDGEAEINDQRF